MCVVTFLLCGIIMDEVDDAKMLLYTVPGAWCQTLFVTYFGYEWNVDGTFTQGLDAICVVHISNNNG